MKYKVGDKVIYKEAENVLMCVVEEVAHNHYFVACNDGLSRCADESDLLQEEKLKNIGVQEMCEALQPATHKTLIIIGVNKDMTTEECIEHAKAIEAHLGNEYRVLVLDEKVSEYEVVEDK